MNQVQTAGLYLTSETGEVFTNPLFLFATCFPGKPCTVAPELPPVGGRSAEVWISPDPARQFHSPYLYAGNGLNPVNFTDANGLTLGPKAEKVWLENVCSDVPFGGSMSLANDWEELRAIPGQQFEFEIVAGLETALTYSTDDIRLPAGLQYFDFLRLFAHEASHTTILSYRENYKALGWRSTKAPWHDDREVHEAKGGLPGLLKWNSTLPRVRGANGYDVWDPFYARDRIYFNEAGIDP